MDPVMHRRSAVAVATRVTVKGRLFVVNAIALILVG
jgi:hypothetical protein